MPDSPLKAQINEAMKAAMRAKEKERLGTIRLVPKSKSKLTSELIQMIPASSHSDKMVKQRRDSIKQFTDAGRNELAAKEQGEIEVIHEFLPQPLSQEEIACHHEAMLYRAASMQDMGKVMGLLKPHMTGRADMGMISGLITTSELNADAIRVMAQHLVLKLTRRIPGHSLLDISYALSKSHHFSFVNELLSIRVLLPTGIQCSTS